MSRCLLTYLLLWVALTVNAQIIINGRKALYDSETNIMLATIPKSSFGSSQTLKIELEEGWSNLKINGKKVNDYYTFNTITGGKYYPITIRNRDQYVITSNITFTFLPIVLLEGDFGYEYQEGRVSLFDPDDISLDTLGGVLKWRGGTTNGADKHKRNYKIKFNEDQQLFGLRTDNKWILDAGQADLFRVRNRIATELWNDMAHKPYYADQEPEARSGVRGRMVELFLNKEYRGIYCLTECMDRKQMKVKKIDKQTGEIRGCLYKAIGYSATQMWNVPSLYDNTSETWESFEVKYPELDDAEETDWSTLWNAINFVVNSNNTDFKAHIAEYFDIPVLIDYYIFINTLNALDNCGKNMYWAVYNKTEDKKLTPAVWDLDASVGQKWVEDHVAGTTGAYSPEYKTNINMKLYNRLKNLNVNNFNEAVCKRYHELRSNLLSTDSLIDRFARYFYDIDLSGAASREEYLWSEDTDIKGEELNFESEIYYISYWLARRLKFLDENEFKVNEEDTPTDIQNISYPNDNSSPTYNLNGQLYLDSSRLKKGIYVKNGKKVVIK